MTQEQRITRGSIVIFILSIVLLICLIITTTLAYFAGSQTSNVTLILGGPVRVTLVDNNFNQTIGENKLVMSINDKNRTNLPLLPGTGISMHTIARVTSSQLNSTRALLRAKLDIAIVDEWCSHLSKRNIISNNKTRVNVSYDDCNPFGMIAGDFGQISNLSKHTSQTTNLSNSFDYLSLLFTQFMDNFEIPTNGTAFTPTINGEALDDYVLFYNEALEVYNSSLVSFTKDLDSDRFKSTVVGINHPYTMTFGNDQNYNSIDFQTLTANLFGFSSKTEFMNYAKKLAQTYASHRYNRTSNEALENGCFYTGNDSFVFPIVVKNDLTPTVLTYVIIDNNGLVSVWINDIDSACFATNFNSSHYTNSTINNELYCKNILFINGSKLLPEVSLSNCPHKDSNGNRLCKTLDDCIKLVKKEIESTIEDALAKCLTYRKDGVQDGWVLYDDGNFYYCSRNKAQDENTSLNYIELLPIDTSDEGTYITFIDGTFQFPTKYYVNRYAHAHIQFSLTFEAIQEVIVDANGNRLPNTIENVSKVLDSVNWNHHNN